MVEISSLESLATKIWSSMYSQKSSFFKKKNGSVIQVYYVHTPQNQKTKYPKFLRHNNHLCPQHVTRMISYIGSYLICSTICLTVDMSNLNGGSTPHLNIVKQGMRVHHSQPPLDLSYPCNRVTLNNKVIRLQHLPRVANASPNHSQLSSRDKNVK